MVDLFKDWYALETPKGGFKEILRLKKMLEDNNIPFVFKEEFGGYHILYSGHKKEMVCSVIEHCGSYGREEDKLEIMGLLTEEELEVDEVKGYLTAEEVFGRIIDDWEK
jgi:hypothetical protein